MYHLTPLRCFAAVCTSCAALSLYFTPFKPIALGSGPQRSSGGLTSLGLSGPQGSLGPGGSSGGAAGAGGRGAGPDHREVRYAEGVLAMINILRVLTLGGPRITDAAQIKQVRVGGCMSVWHGGWEFSIGVGDEAATGGL